MSNIHDLNKSIWPFHETPKDATNPGGSGSNANEGVTLHSPDLRNVSLCILDLLFRELVLCSRFYQLFRRVESSLTTKNRI